MSEKNYNEPSFLRTIAPFLPLTDDLFRRSDTGFKPVEVYLFFFFFRELPSFQFVKAGHQMAEDDAGRDGDVKALGETVHRDHQPLISHGDGGFTEAGQLGAKKKSRFAGREVETVKGHGIFAGNGNDDPVTALFQRPHRLCRIFLRTVVFDEMQPFGRPQGNIGVDGVLVAVLNDVDILDAETVATAQDGTGIVRLVQVLQHDREITCPPGQYLAEQRSPVLCDESFQVGDQLLVHRGVKIKKGAPCAPF